MDFIAQKTGSTPALEGHLGQIGLTIEDCSRENDVLYRALSPWTAARDYSLVLGDSTAFSRFREAWTVEN